jgi:GT2 family glycosyltransferase
MLPGCIVIVDQGNTADVAEWIKQADGLGAELLYVKSLGRSPSSARNQGMEKVRSPFVLAIDDDCLAASDWLEKMALHLRRTPNVIVTGRVEPAGDGLPPTIVMDDAPQLIQRPSLRNTSPLSTGNMGVSTTLARQIGAFDENLFTAEDIDWAYRALRKGIPIFYAPDVIVRHFHWRDKGQSAVNYEAYAKGLGAFYGKHLRLGDWSMIGRILLAIYRGTKSLIIGWICSDEDQYLIGLARMKKLLLGVMQEFRGEPSQSRNLDTR